MSYRKLKGNKYKIEIERTINGERYRRAETIETDFKGAQFKALINSIELKLYNEIENELKDPLRLSEKIFDEIFKIFINEKSLTKEQRTIDYYEQYYRLRTKDFLGHKKITEITEKDIKSFFKMLDNEISEQTKKPLSEKTKKHYLTMLRAVFNYCIDEEIIPKNPTKSIKLSVPRPEIGYYTPNEIKVIKSKLKANGDIKLELYFVLSVTGGLRPSETRAIKWSKVNFKSKNIKIDEAIVYSHTKGYITKSTKTNDIYTMNMTDELYKLLVIHYELERRRLDIDFISNHYIFESLDGSYTTESISKKWKRFCNKYNLRYVPPYGFRHSCATLLAYNNVPMPNIAEHLRHTNLKTTEKYIHAVEEEKERINRILEQTFSGDLNQ